MIAFILAMTAAMVQYSHQLTLNVKAQDINYYIWDSIPIQGEIVITMKITWTYFYFRPSGQPNYMDNMFVDESIDPAYYGYLNTNGTNTVASNCATGYVRAVTATSTYPVYMFIGARYHNSTHYKVFRIMRQNVQVDVSQVANILCPSSSLHNLFRYSSEFTKQDDGFYIQYNADFNVGDVLYTIFTPFTQDADWNDLSFYKYFRSRTFYYPYSFNKRIAADQMMANKTTTVMNIYFNNTSLTRAAVKDFMLSRVANDTTAGHGYRLKCGETVKLVPYNYYGSVFGMTAYVYKASRLYDERGSGASVTLNQSVARGTSSSNMLYASLIVKIYHSGTTFLMDMQLKVWHTINNLDLITETRSAIDIGYSTNDLVNNTLTVLLAVDIGYYWTPSLSPHDNFKMTSIGIVSIWPHIFESSSNPYTNAKRFLVRGSGSHPADSRNMAGTATGYLTLSWQSVNADPYLVRLRFVDMIDALPDYTGMDTGYETGDFQMANTCFYPFLLWTKSSSSSNVCNGWQPLKNMITGLSNCQSNMGYNYWCDFCSPGYGLDMLDYRQVVYSNQSCVSQADCLAAGTEYVWYSSTGPLWTTDTSLCTRCPHNCLSCDIAGNCLGCHPNATLTSNTINGETFNTCECTSINCEICVNKTCDMCKGIYYWLHVNSTNNQSTCEYKYTYSSYSYCNLGFGINSKYSLPSTVQYSTRTSKTTCTTCQVTGCVDCRYNVDSCLLCDTGLSLINLNMAINTSLQNLYLCNSDRVVYFGLYENVTAGKYEECVDQCLSCEFATAKTNCSECVWDYYFVPKEIRCTTKLYCQTTGGYYMSNTSRDAWCFDCLPKCFNCTNNTDCIDCYPNYRFYMTNLTTPNKSTCIPTASCGPSTKTFRETTARVNLHNMTTCFDCFDLCTNCIDNLTCIECDPTYLYRTTDNKCITYTECMSVPQFYNDTNKPVLTCSPCIANCETCTNGTGCLLCFNSAVSPGIRMLAHSGLNLCIEPSACNNTINSYVMGTDCHYCKTNCKSCSNATNCWEGKTNYLIDTDLGNTVLYMNCRFRTTLFNTTHCIDCPANCTNCVYNATDPIDTLNCTSCISGNYLNETNKCEPCNTPKRFRNTTDSRCYLCQQDCDVCAIKQECITCSSGLYYQPYLKICTTRDLCENTYKSYINTTWANPTCPNCSRNCDLCNSSISCNRCEPSAIDSPSRKLFHLVNNLCIDPSACNYTINSYIQDPNCFNCKTNCAKCTNHSNCQECVAGFVIDTDNTACIESCRLHTTHINATHCIECPQNCDVCVFDGRVGTNKTNCTTCLPGYYFDEKRNCVECTQTRDFLINDLCKKCRVDNCIKCVGDPYNCSICENQFYVERDFSCKICSPPMIYTLDRLCRTCLVDNCTTCNKYDVNRCDICDLGFKLNFMKKCEPITFRVQNKKFTEANLQFRVQFYHQVEDVSIDNIAAFAIDATKVDFSPVILNIVNVKKSLDLKSTILVSIKELPEIPELILNLTFKNVTQVVSAQIKGYYLSVEDKTLQFEQLSRYLSSSESLTTSGSVISSTTGVMLAIGSIVSFNYALTMMKIYQMMDYMLLYNVQYPSNFQKFLETFKTVDPLSVMPDIFEFMYDDTCPELGDKFLTQEMGCQLLDNCHSTAMVFCTYLVLRIFINIIGKLVRNKQNKFAVWIRKLQNGVLGPKGLYVLITMFDVDYLIGGFTNSRYYAGDKYRTLPNIFNNLAAATLVCFYPFVIIYYWYLTRMQYKARDALTDDIDIDAAAGSRETYEFLIEDRKDDSWYARYYDVFAMTRNYLICMLVITMYDSPYAQIISTSLLLYASLFFEIKYKPKTTKMETRVNIAVWLSYSMLSTLFLINCILTNVLSKEGIFTYIGYPMMIMFAILVMVNIVPVFIQAYLSLRKSFRKCKQKSAKKLSATEVSGQKNEIKSPELKDDETPGPDPDHQRLSAPRSHGNKRVDRAGNRSKDQIENMDMSTADLKLANENDMKNRAERRNYILF